MSLIDGDEVYTLDELEQKYFRQWLAVRVVERDQNDQPVKVIFLERDVNVAAVRQVANTKDLCTMYTGPIPEIEHLGMF